MLFHDENAKGELFNKMPLLYGGNLGEIFAHIIVKIGNWNATLLVTFDLRGLTLFGLALAPQK